MHLYFDIGPLKRKKMGGAEWGWAGTREIKTRRMRRHAYVTDAGREAPVCWATGGKKKSE